MQAFNNVAGDIVTNVNALANGIPGMALSVRTDWVPPPGTQPNRVSAWRAAPMVHNQDEKYFCHGWAFRTFGLFNYTPFGNGIPRVLADEYQALGPVTRAQGVAAGDIFVWWLGGDPYHSAMVENPHYLNGVLDTHTTEISSKTGTGPLWRGILFTDVMMQYRAGGSIEAYRRG